MSRPEQDATVELPDPDSEFGARVRRRLREDMTAWLTTVDATGVPQPTPVWFLWRSSTALVYTQLSARRLRRLDVAPAAALHLNDDGEGHDVVVLTGELSRTDSPSADRNEAFLAKYGDWMQHIFGSPAAFAAEFSVATVFTPRRVRGI